MIKKIGVTLFALFVIEVAGCNWFFNQKPVCEDGQWDPTVQGCVGMPPLPPMVAAPDVGQETFDELLVCPVDTGTDGD